MPNTQIEILYYIRHKGFCGNCWLWWAEGGHGYTSNLDKAWRVNAEKARELWKSREDEDTPYLVSYINELSERHMVSH